MNRKDILKLDNGLEFNIHANVYYYSNYVIYHLNNKTYFTSGKNQFEIPFLLDLKTFDIIEKLDKILLLR